MTNIEFARIALKKLEEIREAYLEFAPCEVTENEPYLHMCILGNSISVKNTYDKLLEECVDADMIVGTNDFRQFTKTANEPVNYDITHHAFKEEE